MASAIEHNKAAFNLTRKMIDLFPGICLTDLVLVVNCNLLVKGFERKARGTILGFVMSMNDVCEDDNDGFYSIAYLEKKIDEKEQVDARTS
jgi:hypothetical protein